MGITKQQKVYELWLLKWCKFQYSNSEKFLYSDTFLYSVKFLNSVKFLYSDTFLYSEKFLCSVKSLYARKFFKKIVVSKMLRSLSVEQPCWSHFEVHLQAFLRTFLRLLLEKETPQQKLFSEFFKILKTCNAEDYSLQAQNLLKRNSDAELSLDPYRNF